MAKFDFNRQEAEEGVARVFGSDVDPEYIHDWWDEKDYVDFLAETGYNNSVDAITVHGWINYLFS